MSKKHSTYTIPVLESKRITFDVLNKSWGADNRTREIAVQKFIKRNSDSFGFLDIDAVGEYGDNGSYTLKLTASKYVGCIPLFSPKTGMVCGNLISTGRFGEDISELLSIIDEFIKPEFNERLSLSGSFVKPPLYFECQNYIDYYIKARKYKWRKFNNIEKIESKPTASTRWDKYSLKCFDPAYTFRYPNKCNVLTKEHQEWKELNYVLSLCIDEVMSSRTPIRSRMAYMNRISTLLNSFDSTSLPIVSEVKIHMSDPIIVKQLKEAANRVLGNFASSYKAWRLDFAEFFERYTQYLLTVVARSKGAKLFCNPHYHVSGQKPNWALHYIEPDIIIDKGEIQYVVDAKYKAHMYQINGNSDILKNTFREDFHQVLAYSSFGGRKQKHVMLIYPSDHFVSRELDVLSCINGYTAKAYLVGIPLKKSDLEETKNNLSRIINF